MALGERASPTTVVLDELPDLLASAPEIPSIAGAEEPLDEDHEVPLGEACGSDGVL